MNFTIKDNLLYLDGTQVEFIDTPNKTDLTINPLFLIEHFTGDINPKQTINWFKDKEAEASAHLLIDRKGKAYQFVKFNKRAWHAGKSNWDGIEGLNSFSIGIEMTNAGRLTKKEEKFYWKSTEIPAEQVTKAIHKREAVASYWQTYTSEQIDTCKAVSKLLFDHFNMRDVLGHDDIAPGRKSDPGPAFPMAEFKFKKNTLMFKTSANLNLRVGAGTTYKTIEVIPSNMLVAELQREGDWSRVNYQGKLGWVNNKYLKLN